MSYSSHIKELAEYKLFEMRAAAPKHLWVVLTLVLVLGLGRWSEGCWELEKLGLLELKPFFYLHQDPHSGGSEYVLYDWTEESSDCCKWERVDCNATTGRVIGLFLENRLFIPTYSSTGRWHLNSSLFLPFEELKSLSLSGNQIAGCLHDEGFEKLAFKLKKLEVLDLSFNYFNDSSILSSLVEFSSLKSLNLSYNQLRGPVSHTSTGIGGLSRKLSTIEILDLEGNELNDNIWVFLSDFSSIKYLDLSYNYRITGSNYTISEMDNLMNLKELDLRGNEIKSLDSLHGLINLEVLGLNLNILNGSILSSIGPFSKCLKHLSVYPYLEGSIDIKDARSLKKVRGFGVVAVNNNILLLQQSLSLYPSLKSLHFESSSDTRVNLIELRNFTNLEELIVQNIVLPINFIEDIGELTSLRVLSLLSPYIAAGSLPTQGLLQLKKLESLEIKEISLQNGFIENIGALTSLKILSLPDGGLSGTLSTQDICQLTLLEKMDIRENNLRGVLPDCFSNLTFLKYLDLSSNQFSGNLAISPLQSLTSIQFIDLSNNKFQIPSSLKPFFNHSKLKYYHGDNNHIYAETELHSLAVPRFQLNDISLSCCGDAGPLPEFFIHQRELQFVQLSNINLTGGFPSWLLGNNTKLERLLLIDNSLSGKFELTFHSPMKLLELDISSNFFDGHIPLEIGVCLPGLWFLNISKNSFDGSIPTSIGDMKLLRILDLSNNRLYGVIPENLAMGCSSLEFLELSNNKLQGQIFSANFNLTNLSELYLAGNNFTGSIPNSLSKCLSLSKLDIGYNYLSGRFPRWMGNLSFLRIISMPNNHIEGPIPVEFCQLEIIRVLDLSMNNISGTLPSCFSPPLINHVHLSKNRFRGSIPNGICKSSSLVTLDLSNNQLTGNIPDCIDNLSGLSYVVLKDNCLEGEIPNQFCLLEKLSLIDLSQNNLSGYIPSCLNVTTYEEVTADVSDYIASLMTPPFETDEPIELTTKSISYSYKGRILRYLSGIDLSSNKFTGEIPHEMGNFHTIVMLNLSHNRLTGSIPHSLSNLKEIESLDLSYNHLSGSIPFQFVELYSLAYFNVSYNNLSGTPPSRTAQFATDFDENSYWGNPLLCGRPLPKNCSTLQNQPAYENEEGDGLMDMESFYVTFFVSYIIVILSIAVVLYINPYWRQAWFYLIERGIDSCFYFVLDNILPKKLRLQCYVNGLKQYVFNKIF